jgi:hypothetical protein
LHNQHWSRSVNHILNKAAMAQATEKDSCLRICGFSQAQARKYANSMFDCISHEEIPKLRTEIRQTANQIYHSWETLRSIVQRHEGTIQKRWTNKSKTKRRQLLLAAWPNMAQEHRPDIVLRNKYYDSLAKIRMKTPLQGAPLPVQQTTLAYKGFQREALLMPYINLHDLTKTAPLLLMINARARRPPHAFSRRDLQLSTHCMWMTNWRWLEGYAMDLDSSEGYGELREGHITGLTFALGTDPRLAEETIEPGDGLWVLEIQNRLYRFLLEIVQSILHDIPPSDLAGPKYNIQPEPTLPSGNSLESGILSLASTQLEATYSSPGQMDLHRLQLLVNAKASEEEDKLWALREDPGRFSEGAEDYIAHRPHHVPDIFGNEHPDVTFNGCKMMKDASKKVLEGLFSVCFLESNFICLEFWAHLAQDITDLVELKKQHFDSGNIEPADKLPEPFAFALRKLLFTLCMRVEQHVVLLRKAAFSSPPLRPYVKRASSDTLDNFVYNPTTHPPQHLLDFMVILDGLSNDGLRTMGHIASVQMVMEQYDKFINTVPDAHKAVSPYVAKEISDLALYSECLRHIHLFQPWAATLHKIVEAPHVQTASGDRYNDSRHEVIPEALGKYSPSHEVLWWAAAAFRSPYPVHKKRTATSVEAMQNAETLLDHMWHVLLAEMEKHSSLPTHSRNVLLLQGRQMQRTPDWVEPVKSTTKTTPQLVTPELLIRPFGRLDFNENKKGDFTKEVFAKEKNKTKTRAKATSEDLTSPQAQMVEPLGEQSPVRIIKVDQRALKVFSALFHMSSSMSNPGEVPWTELLHAMRSAGFWMEKLYGSVWQFTPRDDNGNGGTTATRSILLHEPHPHSKVPLWHARRFGRRLARAYGWSGQTFVLK